MVTPVMPQQVLIAQAAGLMNTERAFPLGAPPIPIAQGLLSIANALPQTALPGLPALGTGRSLLPAIPGLGGSPLGATPNILASFGPPTGLRSAANGLRNAIAPRTGLG